MSRTHCVLYGAPSGCSVDGGRWGESREPPGPVQRQGSEAGEKRGGPGKLYGARAVCLVGPGGLGKGAGGDSGRCAWKTGTLELGAGAVALQFL